MALLRADAERTVRFLVEVAHWRATAASGQEHIHDRKKSGEAGELSFES